MPALVDLLPTAERRPIYDPPSRRLALAILKQAILDAQAGKRVFLSALEAWGIVAGLEPHRVAAVFEGIRSHEPATLARIHELRKLRSKRTP